MVTIEGQPWFVAADVCRCLGLDVTKGVYKHLEKVDDEDRRPVPPTILRGKGTAHLSVVNESGLYTLILRAQDSNPEAAEFRRWITREVLPSIRKTGAYVTGQPSIVENPKLDPLGTRCGAFLCRDKRRCRPATEARQGPQNARKRKHPESLIWRGFQRPG